MEASNSEYVEYSEAPDGAPNFDVLMGNRLRLAILTCSVFILAFTGLALIALNRTRHIPTTVRFMGSALLVFDLVTAFLFTVRKLITEPVVNRIIQFAAIGWSFMAFITVTMMSVERLVVFQWLNFYLRRVSYKPMTCLCIFIWTIYIGVWTFSTGRCPIVYAQEVDINTCFDNIIVPYIMLTFPTSTVVSCVCSTIIIYIMRRHIRRLLNNSNSWRHHRSTIVVLLCCLNYVTTTILYIIILNMTLKDNLVRRVVMDVLVLLNGLLDTCLHVLWYKECRLELVKMFAKIFPSLNSKAERMRIEIFDIITYSNSSQQRQK